MAPAEPVLPAAVGARDAALAAWCRGHGPLLVGYSGGVDSAYLAAVALEALGPDAVLAVIGRSASFAAAQWRQALDVAAAIGLPVHELATHELDDPRYVANAGDRCFHCKGELWSRLAPLAAARGFRTVVDGTNADDLQGHRPGARAAELAGVRSPLAELGFTKAEVRAASRARGLATWDAPAAPCLASRLPVGIAVTPDRLAQVEAAEAAVRALGIRGDLRVRWFGESARVELADEELRRVRDDADLAAAVGAAVRGAGFAAVHLDLRPFVSGRVSTAGSDGAPALLALAGVS